MPGLLGADAGKNRDNEGSNKEPIGPIVAIECQRGFDRDQAMTDRAALAE
jgi:hypothetical protein